MGKIITNIILAVVLILVVGAGAVFFLILPTRTLNMEYSDIALGPKLQEMLTSGTGTVSITEEDLSSLMKRYIAESMTMEDFDVTGAEINIAGSQLHAYLNVKRGFLGMGIHTAADIALEGDKLIITPTRYWLGRIPLSPSTVYRLLDTFGVQASQYLNDDNQITMNMKKILPSLLALQNLEIGDRVLYVDVKVRLAVSPDAVQSAAGFVLDQEVTQDIADMLQEYSGDQISPKAYGEILSGNISNESIDEITSSLRNMDSSRQQELMEKASQMLDPETIESFVQQFQSMQN